MKRFAIPLAILTALALATVVYAHVVPVGCIPRPGMNLQTPPSQVLCLFSGEADLTKSSLQVLDAQGNRVDRGDAKPFQGDPASLVVSLDTAAMKPGIYTILWTTADFIDRDVISGTLEFGLDTVVPPTPTAVLPGFVMTPQPIQTSTNGSNTTTDLISRFLIGVGVALLGAMGFLFWRMQRGQAVSKSSDDVDE